MAYGWGIPEMGDGCTLIDSHHNSLDGPPIVATCFQQFLLLLFRTSYALSAAAVALLISVFFFFLHKTLLICFTCHTKLELSWVFKKRSAPASPASSTSCPRVCVCVCGDHPDSRYLPPRLPKSRLKAQQSQPRPCQSWPEKRAQTSVLHSFFGAAN